MEMETENKSVPEYKPQGSRTSKTVWYVIGGIVIVLVLWWLAMAIFYTGPEVATQPTTNSNNQSSATVETNNMPDNWPSDAPTYANVQVRSEVTSPKTGHPQLVIEFTTSDSVQTVADFYKTQLTADGWNVEKVLPIAGGKTALAATKGTRYFAVYIDDLGGGKVTVTASVSISK